MKKYIVCAAAFLFIAGLANAQTVQKHSAATSPAKPGSMVTKTTTAHKTAPSSKTVASTSSTSTTQQQATTGNGIKRKHIRKKSTSLKKTASK